MKPILLFAFCIGFFHVVFSQNFTLQDLSKLRSDLKIEVHRNRTLDPAYMGIKGSPYLNDEFVTGEATLDDSIRFEKVPLRYNIYTDKIESLNKDVVIELDLANRAYMFNFGNSVFTGLDYTATNGQEKYGILELLADGRFRLFKRYQIVLKPAVKASGYSEAEPDRFIRLDDEYLIAVGQGRPEVFRNDKELIEKLKSFKPDITQYTKEKKLKLKLESGLIQLVQYCNKN